jgi:hypothetical protein
MAGESSDRGATWSYPERVSIPSDRGNYSAVAASPEGDDLYLVYNAFTTPFRNNTTQARGLVGVVTVAPHLLEYLRIVGHRPAHLRLVYGHVVVSPRSVGS